MLVTVQFLNPIIAGLILCLHCFQVTFCPYFNKYSLQQVRELKVKESALLLGIYFYKIIRRRDLFPNLFFHWNIYKY